MKSVNKVRGGKVMKSVNKVLSVIIVMWILLAMAGCARSKENQPTPSAENQPTPSAENQPTPTEKSYTALDEANVNPKGVFPIVKSPTTLEIAMVQNAKILDYDTNEFTLFLEKRTGIDIQFNLLPAKDTTAKVNLMFASNDLPEVLLGSTMLPDSMVLDFGTQGLIIPLNGLIDQYGDETNRMFAESMDRNLKKTITCSDGNIYASPKISELTSNVYGSSMWVYKPWMDELNIKTPETMDEYYKMLKAFKTMDPNKNGEADEIPFIDFNANTSSISSTGTAGFLINAYIYYNGMNGFTVDNGKVDVCYTNPEFRDAITYLNKLCNEGLLDPMSFTLDTQQMKTLLNQKIPIIGCFSGDTAKSNFLDVTSQRCKDYVMIPPLTGPKGIQYTLITPNVPSNAYCITKDCKSPAAAYRLNDFMYSEESSMRGRYGLEGRDWIKPTTGELSSLGEPAYMKLLTDVWGQPTHNVHWQNQNPGFLPQKIMDGQAWNGDPYEYNHYKTRFAIDYLMGKEPKEYLPAKLNMPLDEMDEYNQLLVTVMTYVNENMTRFIVGDKSLDDWDAYLGEFEKMDLDRLITITQAAYDRAVK